MRRMAEQQHAGQSAVKASRPEAAIDGGKCFGPVL
jgi:hypothetical protein